MHVHTYGCVDPTVLRLYLMHGCICLCICFDMCIYVCSIFCSVVFTVKYESLSADIYDFITHIQPAVNTRFMQIYQKADIPVSFPIAIVNSYLHSVGRNVIVGIQKLYALDFQLFDYPLRWHPLTHQFVFSLPITYILAFAYCVAI